MALRIQGLVAAARRAQERLQEGMAPAARKDFLAEVRRHVDAVDRICREHATEPAALPAPSRRAYRVLREILQGGAAALPRPVTDRAPVPRIRIANILGTLDAILADLGRAEPIPPSEARTRARACVAKVRAICAQSDTTPAGLPPRSGRAFGMLAWLAEAGHAERYRAALERARTCGIADATGRKPGTEVRITIQPGRHVYSIRERGGVVHCRLGLSFLAADLRAMAELASVMAPRPPVDPEVPARHEAFLASAEAVAIQREIEAHWQGELDRSRGTAYDLGALFEKLNAAWFDGRMRRPRLEWRPSLSRSRFGFYTAAEDRVVIDARLDDPAIPEFVAECVLFHELLHKHYGTPQHGGRRQVHPPRFRAHERRHPRFHESEAWLRRLVDGALDADDAIHGS